ncbi:DUF397 domain-containing protein [Actinomadura luteofluorescens]|uniref:DUF397 domain-containing protein n=1 Tax=Actinomadura luteofluorescens TaxID=46163 RepID=UPI003D8D0F81
MEKAAERLPSDIAFRKSSHSGNDSNCVELAPIPGGIIAIRDSKAPDHGLLAVSAGQFAELRRRIRKGALAPRP